MSNESQPAAAQPTKTKASRFFKDVAAYIGWGVVGVPTVYGVLLLSGQLYYSLHDDVWVSLPAKYLFVVPPLPRTEAQLQAHLLTHGVSTQEILNNDPKVARLIRKVELSNSFIDSYLFNWFWSSQSWLAMPSSWLGVHGIVVSMLEFLSVPFLFIFAGLIVRKLNSCVGG